MMVREQDFVEIVYGYAQRRATAGYRIAGTGIDQQSRAVVTIIDEGRVGTVDRGPGPRAKKADLHFGHLFVSISVDGGFNPVPVIGGLRDGPAP
jgi:hypothetical protein